ncbi:gephyrin-like molybdotransferase Glp [Vreelandella populi]|uniref:Molybdopterin molybdenumtransferase n=1 Tax=Vreelandella populi TaxID=2498858 RepID=A0A433LEE6_9GAMM|nr:gephyrin-like molybdotransferase Glp [Halomonas populi]RUR35346.1 molybdopterin molybdenumtransferase MoeA [Halomonas populi]RUR47537.1 molybdopterin molybdenumtransferase MoeA [Halomonas populi]RUR54595.1 molybdopterin molybdenumtransferase MoeA [Halomonas populi]
MTLSCFELGETMLSVSEAMTALMTLATRTTGCENVPLENAYGRRLAVDITAPINVPQQTNAAMDGVALAWPDTQDTRWPVVGDAFAGQAFSGPVPAGQCVRITTGAPLPEGTDTIVMREQLDEQPDHVTINAPDRIKRGQHIRQAGEDIRAGSVALAAGNRLDAASMGLVASLGYAEVSVSVRPRVAIFSTGNEVTAPGAVLPPSAIYDTNRFTLTGLLTEQGAEVIDIGILPDDPDAIQQALEDAAQKSDLVITSGGVSVGQADFTRQALQAMGQLAFWRVALRPGRPMACGLIGEQQTPFVGLPGNPVAVMVTFSQFVVPLLRCIEGQKPALPARLKAIAETPLKSRLQRTDFLRGVYRCDEHGVLHVRATGAQGSGILTSMVAANCLIELGDEQQDAQPGEAVCIQPLARWP